MRLLSAIVFAVVTWMSTAALADSWQVARVTGQAWVYSATGDKTAVSPGDELPIGANLVTEGGTRVLLRNKAQTIIVGPRTSMAISPTPGQGLKTTVLQRSGTVEVEVEKRNVRYFSVETPMLAAVVKGTRFVVNVDSNKAEVSVSRGRVQVTDLATGKVGNVVRGQKATSSRRGFTVTGIGKIWPISNGKPRTPVVSTFGTISTSSAQSQQDSAGQPEQGNTSGASGNAGSSNDDNEDDNEDDNDKGNGGGGKGNNGNSNGGGNGNGNNGNGNGNGGGNGSNGNGGGRGNSGSHGNGGNND